MGLDAGRGMLSMAGMRRNSVSLGVGGDVGGVGDVGVGGVGGGPAEMSSALLQRKAEGRLRMERGGWLAQAFCARSL